MEGAGFNIMNQPNSHVINTNCCPLTCVPTQFYLLQSYSLESKKNTADCTCRWCSAILDIKDHPKHKYFPCYHLKATNGGKENMFKHVYFHFKLLIAVSMGICGNII